MIELTAPIKEVTVYTDRAQVVRKGRVTLEAGEHEIRLNNLPQFQQDSLRANGRGPQGLRILNVDITTAFFARPQQANVAQLQQELEDLKQQKQLIQARQESLKDRRHWLKSLGEQSRDFAKGLAQGQMKPQDCADFFRFMADQSAEDAESGLKLEVQVQQLQLEIDAKKRELRPVGDQPTDQQAAIIAIELANGGEVEFEVSYIVYNASWYPQYDARVQVDATHNRGNVELTYVGMVSQSTGEDWENVALSLSTARPSQVSVLPELKPWYLKVPTPPPAMPMYARQAFSGADSYVGAAPGGAPMAVQAASAAAPKMMIAEAPAEIEDFEAEIATATVERTATALVFRAGRSVDIPSDNSPHKTTISQDNLPCEFDYVSAPELEENAHLRGSITNTTERVLLEGKSNIFLDGEYVGSTYLKQTAPNEKFKIFLGVNDDIKVKRELIERGVDKGILLQSDLRRSTFAYRVTVHNYAQHPHKIVVRDHLPVSQHERIKVKVLNVQPQPTERTKLELLDWEFTLAADREQVIEYRFMIEHPHDLKVIGLPKQ